MSIRIGIMGFGRIGRNVFRILYPRDDIEVVAIVDIADPKALEYLLSFDTVHGRFREPVWVKDGDSMYAKGRADPHAPAQGPGRRGLGRAGRRHRHRGHRAVPHARELLQKHLDAGAKRVILTVPPRDEIDALVVMGVNDHVLDAGDADRQQRLLHRQRPGADLQDPARRVRHRARLHDHGPRLHERPAPGRRAAHRAAPLARRGREHHPHRDLVAAGGGPILPELEGKLDGMALNVPCPTAPTWTSSR